MHLIPPFYHFELGLKNLFEIIILPFYYLELDFQEFLVTVSYPFTTLSQISKISRILFPPLKTRTGNRTGRVGLGRVNGGLSQNRVGSKLTLFFRIKILTAQPVLKIGLIGPNCLLKVKKIRTDRVGPGHTGSGHIGSG